MLSFSKKITPIGLDIGSCSIKAVQLQSVREQWRVAAATSLTGQLDAGLQVIALDQIARNERIA